MSQSKAADTSSWAPFGQRAFALLWGATLISNIGTWMHDVGAGWLMTNLAPSPAIVSLVQAATTLPIFLFALPAGALADRMDKRRFLIAINLALSAVVAAVAFLTAFDLMTPVLLLLLTFLIGCGTAFMAPAWQAVVPMLVPRPMLPSGIALNSMGINISRAIGPALAGFLITWLGLAAPFWVNAASYLVILGALLAWKPPPAPARELPPEPFLGSILTGIRHAARNAALKATMLRAFAFFLFASAYWALLPLVARSLPGHGAIAYGVLLAVIGCGAVGGALLLPRLKARFGPNRLAEAGTLCSAAGMAVFAMAGDLLLALPGAVLGGAGWILVLTSLNLSAQTALPDWVRARGLSLTLMVFFGCMSAGSILWGQVASHSDIPTALILAAACLLVALVLVRNVSLGAAEGMDLSAAMIWDAPFVHEEMDAHPDRGPVMVTVSYRIEPKDVDGFLHAMHVLSHERYRDGAHDWGVYQDAADPRIWLEWFLLPSWAEHLRQHQRVTRYDIDLHNAARRFHSGDAAPEVRHYLAPLRGRPKKKGSRL